MLEYPDSFVPELQNQPTFFSIQKGEKRNSDEGRSGAENNLYYLICEL